MNLIPNVDYSNANWGGEKSSSLYFPTIEKVYNNAFELSHRVLISSKEALDYIIDTILTIQQKHKKKLSTHPPELP